MKKEHLEKWRKTDTLV
jgi:ankyrin repeat protein